MKRDLETAWVTRTIYGVKGANERNLGLPSISKVKTPGTAGHGLTYSRILPNP